jgi:hypothetical protein
VTGDPVVRKMVLDMFHKLDPTVEGPESIEKAVFNMLQVIKGLTENDSGKFVNPEWKHGGGF